MLRNVVKRRVRSNCQSRILLLAAMLLGVGGTTLWASADPGALCQKLEIRSAAARQRGVDPAGRLVIRDAKPPIFAEIDMRGDNGLPIASSSVVASVVTVIDASPGRLVIIRPRHVALRFADLPAGVRDSLLKRRGENIVAQYNSFVASQLLGLLERVSALRPNAALSIRGVPFAGRGAAEAAANRSLRSVLDRLSALVLASRVLGSESNDELDLLLHVHGNTVELAGERAILFAGRRGWRIATPTSELSDESTGVEATPEPHESRAVDSAAVAGDEVLALVSADQSPADENQPLLEAPGGGQPSEPADFAAIEGQADGNAVGGGHGGGGGGGSGLPFGGGAGAGVLAGQGGGGPPPSQSNGTEAGATEPGGGDSGDGAAQSDSDQGWGPDDEVLEGSDSQSGDEGSSGDSSGDAPGGDGDVPGQDAGEQPGGDSSDSGDGGGLGYERPNDIGGHAQVQSWFSWDQLRDLIAGTPDGGTLDIRGKGFRPSAIGESSISNGGKSLKIIGGLISGTWSLDWEPEGGGLFSAEIDLSWLDGDWRVFLLDGSQTLPPVLVQSPSPPGSFAGHNLVRNPNWWAIRNDNGGVVNGVVHTQAGDNVIGGLISGITVTDPAIRASVDELVSAYGVPNVVAMYHAGFNYTTCDGIVAWDSASGRLEFASRAPLTYPGYMNLCLAGGTDLALGEYSFVPTAGRVWYRPANGNPSSAEIPVVPNILRLSGLDSVVQLEGTTVWGSRCSAGGTAALVSATSDFGLLRARNCVFAAGESGIYQVMVDLERCVLRQFYRFGIATGAGARLENVEVIGTVASSAVYIAGEGGGVYDPVPQTLVRRCLLSVPASAHGQCLSMYLGSWQNAVVEENIFLDSPRALSFQPTSASANRRLVPGEFLVRNNLFVLNELPWGDIESGQFTFAFNGAPDDHLDFHQIVDIRHNSFVVNTDHVGGSLVTGSSLSLANLRNSTVRLESNIAGAAGAPDSAFGGPSQLRFGNLFWLNPPGYGSAWGHSDLPTPSSLSEVFAFPLLIPLNDAAFSAADGQAIGVRWEVVPELWELSGLGVDWADYCLPMVLPSPPNEYSTTLGFEDWR